MITQCDSVYSFPGYIDGEPLFKQIKEYTYNSRSPLLQANSQFITGLSRYPPPWVKPQAVKDVVKQFDTSRYFSTMA